MPPLTPMPGRVVSEWAASCVVGRMRTGAGGSRPRGGKPFNHPPRIAAARAKRINGRDDEAREGGREGGRVPPRPSLFIMWQKSRSAPPFIPSSHFSLKRERRGGGIRVIEARNLTTAGGRKERRRESAVRSDCIAFIIIQFPSLSPSLESYYRRRNAARGRPRSLTRARVVPRQRDWKEARERWSCEIFARTKANRSILRSAFLFESGHISFQ